MYPRAMRWLTFVLSLLVLSASANSARAESDEAPPAWTLQVDPLTTALGFVHLQAEPLVHDQTVVLPLRLEGG